MIDGTPERLEIAKRLYLDATLQKDGTLNGEREPFQQTEGETQNRSFTTPAAGADLRSHRG